MSACVARRIFLMLPTLLGILFVSFVVVQFAPGGPVERVLAQLSGADTGGSSRISGSSGGDFGARAPVGAAADVGGVGWALAARGGGSGGPPMRSARNIGERRGWIRISSRAWKSSSASTSR